MYPKSIHILPKTGILIQLSIQQSWFVPLIRANSTPGFREAIPAPEDGPADAGGEGQEWRQGQSGAAGGDEQAAGQGLPPPRLLAGEPSGTQLKKKHLSWKIILS